MGEVLALFSQMRWQDVIDIALVTVVVYQIILLLRGTRAMHMLAGLGLIFLSMVASRLLGLRTINWILSSFFSSLILVLIILFQSDIRRLLARLGGNPFLGGTGAAGAAIEEVVAAAAQMSRTKTGALMVLERRIGLVEYMEVGSRLDSEVTRDLLITLFQTCGPLHDGAVLISGNRLVAARCVLPLTANPSLDPHLGTRHRAAIGLSEETDAISVVVSEETGGISLASGGKIIRNLDPRDLRQALLDHFKSQDQGLTNLRGRLFSKGRQADD